MHVHQVPFASLLLLFSAAFAAGAEGPVRVLVLSGQNNHNWQETTPAIQRLLEETGRFVVEVTDHPEAMTTDTLAPFDVVVSNWNVRGGDPAVDEWPEVAHAALQAFVRGGKGHVTFHAGASSHYDRPEYQNLGLTWWDIGTSGHGPLHAFPVTIADPDHPVTRGLRPFVTFDELWHRTGIREGAHVLATSYSSSAKGGTDSDEPAAVVAPYDAGRTASLILGHDARTLSNPSTSALLARLVEWAATGDVTLPPPRSGWEEADGSLARVHNGEILWRFNGAQGIPKPFFDPVRPAGGPSLTWDAPHDHVWHHGLWFSWKEINGVVYWESPESGTTDGLTLWDPPAFTTHDDGSAEIRMSLRYQDPAGIIVLREERELRVSLPDNLGGYTMDWQSVFTAGDADVVLDRTPIVGQPGGVEWGGYAGLSVRMPNMEEPVAVTESGPVEVPGGMGEIVSGALGISGKIDGRRAGVAIVPMPGGHPAPVSWYAISQPEFMYFSPAVIYRAPLTLAAGESLTLAYRILIHHDALEPQTLGAELARMEEKQ